MSGDRRCPDDGRCHHGCGSGSCFRVIFCLPLSGYAEHWPDADVAANPPAGLADVGAREATLLGLADG